MGILIVKNKLTGDLSDTHPSCEYADVNHYVTVANPGDTIQLPVGAATWGVSTTSAGTQNLPTGTFNVASTTGFLPAGTFTVSGKVVTYAGLTAFTFTGCTNTGTASVPAGSSVVQDQVLTFAKDISIIGAGPDYGHATPSSSLATIITAANTTGGFINATYQNSPTANWKQECRISGMVVEQTQVGTSYLLNLGGRCYRRRDASNNIVGGLRVDNMRFRNSADSLSSVYALGTTTVAGAQTMTGATPFTLNVVNTADFLPSGSLKLGSNTTGIDYTGKTQGSFTGCTGLSGSAANGATIAQLANIGANGKLVVWGGPTSGNGAGTFVTGSYDHNFSDYIVGTSGSETCSFGCSGSPLTSTGQVITPNGFGQYQWEQDYTFGGGDDTELNVIYIEDNIFHRWGFVLGTLSGGGRIISRHNTSWGGISGHGIDSGSNFGTTSWETYNNYFDHTNSPSSAASIGTRGGAHVIFNNRFTDTPNDIASQTYRPFSNKSDCIGPATGRNFLDENFSGNILAGAGINGGDTYTALRGGGIVDELTDPRIGSVYAMSISNNVGVLTAGLKYTLNGLDSSALGVDHWKGFTIVNTSIPGGNDPASGDQGNTGTANGQYSGYISSSTAANPTVITVTGGGNGNFNLVAGQNWEIRRVKTYLCNPGTGKLPKQSSGLGNKGDTVNGDQTGCYYIQSDANGKHKYWAGAIPFGIWQSFNLTRANTGIPWNTAGLTTTIVGGNSAITVPGGFQNGSLPLHKKNDGTGTPYPTRTNSPDSLRIGAHWQAPGYTEGIDSTAGAAGGAATQAYGGAWPNAMVGGTVVAKPVITSLLTASGTIGVPFTYTIVASNNPTTYGATGLPSMIGINAATGVISGTNDGQPATYSVTITAANGGGQDTETLVITMSGLGSGKRGKGVARRIGAGARRL